MHRSRTNGVLRALEVDLLLDPDGMAFAKSAAYNRKRHDDARSAIQETLQRLLWDEVPIAPLTDMESVLLRAANEQGPTLLVTDGKNEKRTVVIPRGTGEGGIVVRCAAQGDNPLGELDLLGQRQQLVARILPFMSVFPCYQLEKAVAEWARRIGEK